ncbi:HK97 family phage prohead protease [Pseudovibrio ascidiaceicola]|uniref:HK97 family phage prohead protease n=1 Tax=Pseudovibrio ascidiaceicola TaxID=285279 RepID=UPI003D35D601
MKTKGHNSSYMKSGGQRLFVKEVGEDGSFEGYGSVFGVEDSYSEVVAPGAFRASLAAHKKEGTLPAMLWQHDPGKPIGVYEEMREDEKGLLVKGRLSLDTQHGKEAYALLKVGALNGLSIGFRPVKSSFDEDTRIRTLKEIDLWEVSLVTFPANGQARIEGVKSLEEISGLNTLREIEQHLREEGGYSNSSAKALIRRTRQLLDGEREARSARAETLAGAKRLTALLET